MNWFSRFVRKTQLADKSRQVKWGDRNAINTLADKAVGMLQADNQQEALTCIDHAMSMNPQMPQFFFLHIVRSAALIGVGRYEEAVGECDQGLVHYPGNPELLKNKGIALKKLGRS